MTTGYLDPAYAESLSEFGKPRLLPRCGGWILERPIPGFPYHDGMGCYPLFCCQDWSELQKDLANIESELISLAVVTDPFGNYDTPLLQRCFEDRVVPYKQHFVADLSQPMDQFVSAHHRRYARRGLQQVEVERCQDPIRFLGEWTGLYENLIARHRIRGINAFSKAVFEKQFRVPGMTAFRAIHEQYTVGMILWYVQNNVGYYHLGACCDTGYRLRASFALFWTALEYFITRGIRWVNLGAAAGVRSCEGEGLTRFKRGWSTGTQTAYFCGRILNRERYLEIMTTKNIPAKDYFPIYRSGEFH